jgi:cell division transport system ATP-binding protein
MIQFVQVSKRYESCDALMNINFEVEMGEFVFFVGPSGAGKSSIMKLIYREEKPTSGKVLVGRIDVSTLHGHEIPKLRRRMGIVFQDFKLLPGQSAYDNVAYVLRALGVSQSEINKRVLGALKVVGLIDKIDAPPEELSGGEQQRVGIARAIVNGPAIVIADEPTGNLDPESSSEIMGLLDQINKRGTTVLITTHNHQIVNQMKKRVVVMRGGEMVSDIRDGAYL